MLFILSKHLKNKHKSLFGFLVFTMQKVIQSLESSLSDDITNVSN